MVLTVRFEGEWLMTGSGVRHVQGLWDSLVQSLSIVVLSWLKNLSLFRSYRKSNNKYIARYMCMDLLQALCIINLSMEK